MKTIKRYISLFLTVSMLLTCSTQVVLAANKTNSNTRALPASKTVYGTVSHEMDDNNYAYGNVEVTINEEDAAEEIVLDFFEDKNKLFGEQYCLLGSWVDPAQITPGDFKIINNSGYDYKVTGFYVESGFAFFNRMYNEAAVAGIGPYNAVNEKILADMPGEEWYKMNADYFGEENFNDPKVLEKIITSVSKWSNGSKESEPRMIELGERYIYYKMELSFNTDETDGTPINNQSSNYDISIMNYINQSDATKDIVLNKWFADDIGEEGFSSKMGYGFVLPLGNAYNGSLADIQFTLTLSRVAKFFKVEYDPNDGTEAILDENGPYDQKAEVTVLPNEFERDGYVFTGWNTSADGTDTEYSPGDKFKINEDTTLYAQWREIKTYKVEYDSNDGTGTIITDENSPYDENTEVTVLPNEFERDRYVFTGWNTSADGLGTNYFPDDKFKINEDTTLYAQWRDIETFKVEYNSNDGTGTIITDENSPYN